MKVVGLNEEKIKTISNLKNEDKEILDYRLKCYDSFKNMDLPSFGPAIDLDFEKIVYYKNDDNRLTDSWDKINKDIKNEFCNLGVISSEEKMDGIGVQYESEVIYHNMLKELEEKNVIFLDTDSALKKYPSIFKKYFINSFK